MIAGRLPVIIVGSGIAGLSLGRILAEGGFPVRIFERASATRREGFGISLRGWASRPFCDEIGLEYQTFVSSCAADAGVKGHGQIDPVLYDLHTGDGLGEPAPAPTGSPRASVFRANRNRIRSTLMTGLDVTFDVALNSVDTTEAPQRIRANFSNGEEVEGCLLVGADGVHSTLRSLEFAGQEPAVVPAAIASGTRRISRSDFDVHFAPYLHGNNAMLAVADYVLVGLTVVDLTDSSAELFWSFIRPVEGDVDALFLANQNTNGSLQLRDLMRTEIPKIKPIVAPYSSILDFAAMKDDEMFNWLMRRIRVPLSDLLSGLKKNIVLIGDAAHAMPFFAGEGGNHAMLDGVELGQQIKNGERGLLDSVADFYRQSESRWDRAVSGSTQAMSRLTKPLEEWRRLAHR